MATQRRRRMQGTGTIYKKQTPYGVRWIAQVWYSDPVTGAAKRKQLTGKTLAEAKEKLAKFDGSTGHAGMTVRQLVDYVREHVWSQKDHSPTTTRNYKSWLDDDILPFLGDIKAANLNNRQIQVWVNGVKGNVKPTRCLTLLSGILSIAIRQQIIPGPNPCAGVTGPKRVHKDVESLGYDDLSKLIRSSAGMPWEGVVTILALTGLRVGEAVGLRWDKVVLDGGEVGPHLLVREQIVEIKEEGDKKTRQIPKALKTRNGSRNIPICEPLRQYLESVPKSGLYVMPGADGGPMFTWVVRDLLEQACTHAEVARVTPHGLRHTFASIVDDVGATRKQRDRLMGHATPGEDVGAAVYVKAFWESLARILNTVAEKVA